MDNNESFKKARELYKSTDDSVLKKHLEDIFPQLKNYESEKIRNKVIEILKMNIRGAESQMQVSRRIDRTYEVYACNKVIELLENLNLDRYDSDDEIIRKKIIDFLKHASLNSWGNISTKEEEEWIAWLDKIKIYNYLDWSNSLIKGGDVIVNKNTNITYMVLATVAERNYGKDFSTFCESELLGVDGVVYANNDDFKNYRLATYDERAVFLYDLKVGTNINKTVAEYDISMIDNIIDDETCGLDIEYIKWLKELRERCNYPFKPEYDEDDERIRSAIFGFINKHQEYSVYAGVSRIEMLDWLQKHKQLEEPKDISLNSQKHTEYNVNPKFKVGDRITNKDLCGTIKLITDSCYVLNGGLCIPFSEQDEWKIVNVCQMSYDWSENDQRMFLSVLWHLRNSVNNGDLNYSAGNCESWLKTIRKRFVPKTDENCGHTPEQKFKKGDRVRNKISGKEQTITVIFWNRYEGELPIYIADQDDWELVEPNE